MHAKKAGRHLATGEIKIFFHHVTHRIKHYLNFVF